MPTSVLRGYAGLLQPIGLPRPPSYRPNDVLIGPWSWEAIADPLGAEAMSGPASTTYPAASRVIAYPFALSESFLVQKVWWLNGATATTDSCDVGVYTEDGATLLVHGGSTAIATANVVQEADPADVLLGPGRYWCAYVQGGVTATPQCWTPAVALLRCTGVAQQAGSGSTLGSTFTPAAAASAVLPICGIASRTQVA